MDDLRLGRLLRVVRQRLGWRQIDVAHLAKVSQQLVAAIEAGRLESISVGRLRAVATVLEIRLPVNPQWRGGAGDALLDARHLAIVNSVVAILNAEGWICVLEYSFNHYGERGSVDILAWQPTFRALLIVEVKSRILDVQALFFGVDRKTRLLPQLVARDRGWKPTAVGRLVVVEELTVNRSVIRRNAATFGAALPARSREIRTWLRAPASAMAGVWFLTLTSGTGAKRKSRGVQRVRTPRSRSAGPPASPAPGR